MTKLIVCLGLMFNFLVLQSAEARDERLKMSISDALTSTKSSGKLEEDIKLVFGTKTKFDFKKKLSEVSTNRKTNAFNKSDKVACEWAFLSAMIAFQERARSEGGDAVINIRSNYKNSKYDSDEIFECGAGTFVAGVTFVGDVVKTK